MTVTTPDPLAGFREELNSGARTSLMWSVTEFPDCPVQQGDVFNLRSCTIEITSTRKIRRQGAQHWLALFDRSQPQRTYLLGKAGGYVEDPRESMRDDPKSGAPFEPEAVPPDEVDRLPSTQVAKARHKEQKDQERRMEKQCKDGEREIRDLVRRTLQNVPEDRREETIARIKNSVRDIASEIKRS